MLASLARGESCQTQKLLFSSFSSHLQWQEQKVLPFGDVLQHYSQACIYSCPTGAAGSCPGSFFLICFHRRIAEGGSWFTNCIPVVTKLWSGVETTWGLEFCTAAEQRREILWWAAPKPPIYSPISFPKLPAIVCCWEDVQRWPTVLQWWQL